MNCFTEEQLDKISHLVREIEKLSDVEKLFLYIQLPSGKPTQGKSKLNGNKSNLDNLFTRKPDQETSQTYTWILSHLEVDQNVSLPKQEVYDEYKAFCQANRFEPLCVADFGKAMKHAFPCIKPRRLGQRGSSRYCYSGLRKRYKIQPPVLPDLIEPTFCMVNDCSQAYNQIIRDCRDNPNECPLNSKPNLTGYEVMNLKIDPAIQQDQFNLNYHSNNNNNNNNNHNQQQNSSEMPLNHGGSIKQTSQLRLEAPKSSSAGGPMTVRTAPIPPGNGYGHLSSASSHSGHQSSEPYTYAEMIQQPGTPDDDDYRHNYQDISPMINLFQNGDSSCNGQATTRISRPSVPTTNQTVTTAATGSDFIYSMSSSSKSVPAQLGEHPARTPPLTSAGAIMMRADGGTIGPRVAPLNPPHQNPQQQFQQPQETNNSHIIGGGDLLAQTSAGNTIGSIPIYPTFTQMDGAHIDYCASPFQSPASTPYPMMCNYLAQDVPDYYQSECMRYPD